MATPMTPPTMNTGFEIVNRKSTRISAIRNKYAFLQIYVEMEVQMVNTTDKLKPISIVVSACFLSQTGRADVRAFAHRLFQRELRKQIDLVSMPQVDGSDKSVYWRFLAQIASRLHSSMLGCVDCPTSTTAPDSSEPPSSSIRASSSTTQEATTSSQEEANSNIDFRFDTTT